jgi:hypothetical protein
VATSGQCTKPRRARRRGELERAPGRAQRIEERDRARGGKGHQHRHERVAIAREHVEDRDAAGEQQRGRPEHPDPPPVGSRRHDARERERREQAEAEERMQRAQQGRTLGVRLDALRIRQLARVPDQRPFAREQAKPVSRLPARKGQRAIAPVVRDLRGRERATERLLGQLACVVALETRAAAAGSQRLVAARRAGMIADPQIGPELGRRHQESPAERLIAQPHGQERKRQPEREQAERERAPRRCARRTRDPDEDRRERHQHERVLAQQGQKRERDARRERDPRPIPIDQKRERQQEQREEECVE